ncbi:MAG: hypothetical protein Q4F57_09550 [Weeksellaceae bacterium]|nr:hypothetical protein [Weeksellaceae bacterium]
MKLLDVFCEIECLTDKSKQFIGIDLQKKWFKTADKRFIGQYLQKFIYYNSKGFDFLGVNPLIIGTDHKTALTFRTTQYIGAIPLRACDTGKQIGDFVVMPRFTGRDRFEDYIEILNILGTEIRPEVIDSIPLASGNNFRPPFYLEAVNFIKVLQNLTMKSWRKFDNLEIVSNQPMGQINWTKFINNEYKIENRLKIPVKSNVMSEFHSEYSEIRHVFDICKGELLSANTPQRIKNSLRPRISFLEEKLYHHIPKATKKINIRFSDSPAVKEVKEQANRILSYNFVESTAWRVDFSDVFEKFIQHIFREVAKETGGRLYSNFKFHSNTSKYYSWELKHLEPDAIFQKQNYLAFIDAKYKSHLYNKFDQSVLLKKDHRHDIHQILSYTSFGNIEFKCGFLCYPSSQIELKNIQFNNRINDTTNTIIVLGVPLKKDQINETKKLIINKLNEFEEKNLT